MERKLTNYFILTTLKEINNTKRVRETLLFLWRKIYCGIIIKNGCDYMKRSKLTLTAFIFSFFIMLIGILMFILFWSATTEISIEDGTDPWPMHWLFIVVYATCYFFQIAGTILLFLGYYNSKLANVIVAFLLMFVPSFVLGTVFAIVQYILLVAAIISQNMLKQSKDRSSKVKSDDSFVIY